MENIIATVKGTKLILEIDLEKSLGASSTGKNIMVAKTGGNIPIEGTDIIMGLNAYKKKAA